MGRSVNAVGKQSLAIIAARSRAAWARLTPEQRTENYRKALQTKVQRYGTGNPGAHGRNPYSRCRSGKRADLGGLFVRSSWEANYARYLNMLVSTGEIASWAYEPETFVFEGVTRGAVTYTPDFRVVLLDGAVEYHEVKGWMTPKARVALKRMGEFHPDVNVILIDEKPYRAIKSMWESVLPGWE